MIAVGSDHGGLALKQEVMKHLEERGIEYKDFGTYDEKSCDYPVFAKAVCKSVVSGEAEKGIVFCTSGIGISIACNKVKGIRCAHCSDAFSAKLTREDNDANVLSLGGGMVGPKFANEIVDTFLDTPFTELEKHKRRIALIEEIENEQ
ncbi:MAG: ribose 5-phosphate isomerase B [Lachnospiraceae bacterium]|nr:ribose 5-phosphate isomerase B [Lachnospiraceae bacterium]